MRIWTKHEQEYRYHNPFERERLELDLLLTLITIAILLTG